MVKSVVSDTIAIIRLIIKQYMDSKKKKIIAIALVLLVLVVGGVYYYNSSQSKNDPEALIAKEALDLSERVGEIMELPDELPAVATIVDESKITNEPFFNGAKNGDKILVFVQSQKIVIYRPSTNKIINSTTLSLPTR